jgi:hypothetical protein
MVYIGKYHNGLISHPNSDLHSVEINVLFIYLLLYYDVTKVAMVQNKI